MHRRSACKKCQAVDTRVNVRIREQERRDREWMDVMTSLVVLGSCTLIAVLLMVFSR